MHLFSKHDTSSAYLLLIALLIGSFRIDEETASLRSWKAVPIKDQAFDRYMQRALWCTLLHARHRCGHGVSDRARGHGLHVERAA